MIRFIKSAKSSVDYPESLKEVVLIGRSNVGKSSFINAVFNQKAAYVGKTPGKTRLLNFFAVDDRYTLVDVPGYGFAKLSNNEIVAFGEMMEEYFSKRQALKLLVMITDIRHKPTGDDLDMIEFARYHHLNTLVIANKADKLSNNQCLKQIKLIKEVLGVNEVMAFSAIEKTDSAKIRDLIEKHL